MATLENDKDALGLYRNLFDCFCKHVEENPMDTESMGLGLMTFVFMFLEELVPNDIEKITFFSQCVQETRDQTLDVEI